MNKEILLQRISIKNLVTYIGDLPWSQKVSKGSEACNLILCLTVQPLPKLAGNISSIGASLMKKQGSGLQSMPDI